MPNLIKKYKINLFLLFAITVLLRILFKQFIIDDAYITFRYVLNILDGKGFVYNVGERVLGTTTPLYTLLVSLGGLIFGRNSIIIFSNVINIVSDGFTSVLLFLIVESAFDKKLLAYFISLIFATYPDSIIFATTGMESSFFTFLIVLSFYLLLSKRIKLSLLFSSLAILTRPEGILLIPIIIIFFYIKKIKIRIKDLWVFIIPLLIWESFSLLYFHTLIPHSVLAKNAVFERDTLGERFIAFYDFITFWSCLIGKSYEKDLWWKITFAVLYFSVFIIGMINIFKTKIEYFLFPFFVIFYMLFFIYGNPLMFGWYYIPMIPMIILGFIVGIWFLIQCLFRNSCNKFYGNALFVLLCVYFIIIHLSAFVMWHRGKIIKAAQPGWTRTIFISSEREEVYKKVSEKMKNTIGKNSTVLASEIGVIGYVLMNNKILDSVGIVSPEIIPIIRKSNNYKGKINIEILRKYKPDYIFALDEFYTPGLKESEEFKQNYELLHTTRGEFWGVSGLSVYTMKK